MPPFVFRIPTPLGFTEKTFFAASDKGSFDLFGRSIAIDGNIAVVGALGSDQGGLSNAGAVYVFEFAAGVWTEVQKFTASDKAANDNFGNSVGISGTTIVVGAPQSDPAGVTNAGAAYIFEKAGTWPATETQKITASDKTANDAFGNSVGISGTTIVVGAPQSDPAGVTNTGAAYIFEKAGTWPATETQKITASDKGANDAFGVSVAIAASVVVVGAFASDPAGLGSAGAAYIFEKAGTWPATETQKITASDKAANDVFGVSVAIAASVVVVGARGAQVDGTFAAGAAYIFEKVGTWPATETQRITASDKGVNDRFGISVATDGTNVIVGSYNSNPAGLADAGAAYIFEKAGTWPATETQKITAGNKVAGDNFGRAVGVSGASVVVGADLATVGGVASSGASYVFTD